MRQEEKEYYESEDSSFKMDLHYGKIKIYEVPFEYRTRNAYLYAHEYTLAVYDGSEKAKHKKLDLELLKHQLLDDIIENEKRGLTFLLNTLPVLRFFVVSSIVVVYVGGI